MGRFFECEDYSVHNEIVDGVRELVGKFPEIFTDFEMCASIPGTTGSIALFVGDDDVIVVNTYMGDDGVGWPHGPMAESHHYIARRAVPGPTQNYV